MARTELGWSQFLSMGAVTAGVVVVGLVLGLVIDHLSGTSPVFLFVGLVIGLIGATAYNIVTIRTYLKN